jgi:hypothetical protein
MFAIYMARAWKSITIANQGKAGRRSKKERGRSRAFGNDLNESNRCDAANEV